MEPNLNNRIIWERRERAIIARALELTRGVPPEFNMAPTIELIRQAWEMGYDVVRKIPEIPEVSASVGTK